MESIGAQSYSIELIAHRKKVIENGYDLLCDALSKHRIQLEIKPFEYSVSTTTKRSVGGKFAQGLQSSVSEAKKTDPLSDLNGVRRWVGAVRQSDCALMFINIATIRSVSLGAPVIFPELQKLKRPIIIGCKDATIRPILTAKIDLNFKKISPEVLSEPGLTDWIIERIRHPRSLTMALRALQDMRFIVPHIKNKLRKLDANQDFEIFSREELVNIIMLVDLMHRYQSMIDNFKLAVTSESVQITQIIPQFVYLMGGVNFENIKARLLSFYDQDTLELAGEIKNWGALYGLATKFIKKIRNEKDISARYAQFFSTIEEYFIHSRIRLDPELWSRCHFIRDRGGSEVLLLEEAKDLLRAMLVSSKSKQITEQASRAIAEKLYKLFQYVETNILLGGEENHSQDAAERIFYGLGEASGDAALKHSNYISETGEFISDFNEFMSKFNSLGVTEQGIKRSLSFLRKEVFSYSMAASDIEVSVLRGIGIGESRNVELLKHHYLSRSVGKLNDHHFHLPLTQNSFELGLISLLAKNQLGLFVTKGNPEATVQSTPLKVRESTSDKVQLVTPPRDLLTIYSELVSLRVKYLTRSSIYRKLNYYKTKYGENYLDPIYDKVVKHNHFNISRPQFAAIVSKTGVLSGSTIKRWADSTNDGLFEDELLTVQQNDELISLSKKNIEFFNNFTTSFNGVSHKLAELVRTVRKKSVAEGRDAEVFKVIWSLFQQGIPEPYSPDFRRGLKKSIVFKALQKVVADVFSSNYTKFTEEVLRKDKVLYFLPPFHFMAAISEHLLFIDNNRVIKAKFDKYLSSDISRLDEYSKLLNIELKNRLPKAVDEEYRILSTFGAFINSFTNVWSEYSRHLTIYMLDRIIAATGINEAKPDKININNVYYLPDVVKLCMGRASIGTETLPFVNLLRAPENMGSVAMDPKVCSTTVDEFSIIVSNLRELAEELLYYGELCTDLLSIIEVTPFAKSEAEYVTEYEQALIKMRSELLKPLRYLTEKEVKKFDDYASELKRALEKLNSAPTHGTSKFTNQLMNRLKVMRSDAHSIKLNCFDKFIIDKTTIVISKERKTGSLVRNQEIKEVEKSTTHLTLASKIRNSIEFQRNLHRKRIIVIAPEYQKKKQVDYAREIITMLSELKGQRLRFYLDATQSNEDILKTFTGLINPYNLFEANKVEPVELKDALKLLDQ